MQRKSNIIKHSVSGTMLLDETQYQSAIRKAKKNFTMARLSNKPKTHHIQHIQHNYNFNPINSTTMIINKLIEQLINNLSDDIKRAEEKTLVRQTIKKINNFDRMFVNFEDPEKDQADTAKPIQQQPNRSTTDPIGGFNKEHFIKKSTNQNSQLQYQLSTIKQQNQNINIHTHLKKLPSLMKNLSQKKIKNTFIPLQQITNTQPKRGYQQQDMMRDRLIREIQNKRLKQRIQALASTAPLFTNVINNNNNNTNTSSFNKKTNDANNQPKQDYNFDYDGSKITVANSGKVKSNINILKTQYKFPKDKLDINKNNNNIGKKIFDRIDFVPRVSRQHLEVNNKTISDFGNVNQSNRLKQLIQVQLRRTNAKFNQKEVVVNVKNKQKTGTNKMLPSLKV